MESDNLSLQIDEVEALASIYGDEWQVENAASRIYCIDITDGKNPPERVLNLQVTLPEKYPSCEPPLYQLNAPWLRGQDKQNIQNTLEELYVENMGESIIYIWVEKIREILVENSLSEMNTDGEPSEKNEGNNNASGKEFGEDFVWDPRTMEKYTHYQKPDSLQQSDGGIKMPEIHTGGTLADRRSVFQAHLAAVTCKEHVDMVMKKLLENKKIASATHNIIAYRIIEEGKSVVLQGCADDGEIHAGSRMLHLLQIVDARNVLVIVTRWYGGIHLGPDRFKHINNCTRQILVTHGYITDKSSTSPKKGKHKS